MSWLTDAFVEQSVAWLIISTAVAIIAGFLSSLFTYRFKRQEIVDAAVVDIQKMRHELALESENFLLFQKRLKSMH